MTRIPEWKDDSDLLDDGGRRPRLRWQAAAGRLGRLCSSSGPDPPPGPRCGTGYLLWTYGLRPVGLLDDDDPVIRFVSARSWPGLAISPRRPRTPYPGDHHRHPLAASGDLSGLIRSATDIGAHVSYLPSFLSALRRGGVVDMASAVPPARWASGGSSPRCRPRRTGARGARLRGRRVHRPTVPPDKEP